MDQNWAVRLYGRKLIRRKYWLQWILPFRGDGGLLRKLQSGATAKEAYQEIRKLKFYPERLVNEHETDRKNAYDHLRRARLLANYIARILHLKRKAYAKRIAEADNVTQRHERQRHLLETQSIYNQHSEAVGQCLHFHIESHNQSAKSVFDHHGVSILTAMTATIATTSAGALAFLGSLLGMASRIEPPEQVFATASQFRTGFLFLGLTLVATAFVKVPHLFASLKASAPVRKYHRWYPRGIESQGYHRVRYMVEVGILIGAAILLVNGLKQLAMILGSALNNL